MHSPTKEWELRQCFFEELRERERAQWTKKKKKFSFVQAEFLIYCELKFGLRIIISILYSEIIRSLFFPQKKRDFHVTLCSCVIVFPLYLKFIQFFPTSPTCCKREVLWMYGFLSAISWTMQTNFALLCFILISFLLLPLDSLIYLIFLFVFLSHLYVFVLFLVSFLSFPYFSFPFLFFYFLILIFYFSLFKYFLASPSIPKKNRKKELHADYVSKFHHYTESFLLNMLMIR